MSEQDKTYEWIKNHPGRNTRRLAKDLGYTIPKMRNLLRELKRGQMVDWEARCLGCEGFRSGWTRAYYVLKKKHRKARAEARKVVAGYE